MNLAAAESGIFQQLSAPVPQGWMQICIAGWYFRERLFRDIQASGYPAFVIKHREGNTGGIPSALYDNRGLEFGAYRDFAAHHWDRLSDVLFMHDDTELDSLLPLCQAESLRTMGVDHAYIFQNAYEELCNGGAHGRAMWMSAKTLQVLADDFPADLENISENVGRRAQRGIFMFHERVSALGPATGVAAIIPGFQLGHRGRMNGSVLVFKRTNIIPGAIINA